MTKSFSRSAHGHRGCRNRKNAGASAQREHLHDHASALIQDRLFEDLASVGRAVASKQRLELLEPLAQAERTVEVVAREANLPGGNVSQYPQVLRTAGLIEATKSGLCVSYRLAGHEVLSPIRAIRAVAEKRLGELDRLVRSYLTNSNRLELLTSVELLRRLRVGDPAT